MDAPAPADSSPSTADPTLRAPDRARVLVVDDEITLQRAFVRVLERAGYEVAAASEGTAAIEAVAKQPFDAVVSDINMPHINGIELMRQIRNHDMDVPILLVTGAPSLETAVQAVEFGACQYMVKPVAAEVLLRAVARAVRLRRLARAKNDAMKLLGTEVTGSGDRVGLEASFDSALASLWMAFQPIITSDGALFGYEALLRSREPRLPHPGAVLDAAERLGRVPELGRVVRDKSAAAFRDAPPNAVLFINLHAQDLLDETLSDPSSALSQIADRVILEITERASLHDVRDIKARIAALRKLGFRVAVDDLGAGYAGLTSFTLLEPEVVKLDMSLVRDVDQSATKRSIIGAMSLLCRDLKMQVVAEGIETAAERDAILELGCGLLQGYLFGKPGEPFPAHVF